MKDSLPEIPKQWIKGMVPTLNDKGFMFEVLDAIGEEFIRVAGESEDEVLDIGCAYGVTTIPALKAGARVTASDMDPGHLEILKSRTPEEALDRLTLITGLLPDIDLPENHFGAILCSRVLHFLPGDEIDASVRNMYHWLKPGGRLFLIADTPWGIWRNFIPTWEDNVAKGKRWPGHMPKPINFLPFEPSGDDVGPELMNLLAPDLLQRTCEEAGFVVDEAVYVNRIDFGEKGRMDGRENCALVAHKPE
jgi:SAM-dependent methyltransferase